jgi:hypothetical protein
MAVADADAIEGSRESDAQPGARRRWLARIAAGVALAGLIGGGAAWLGRERIARNAIDDYLIAKGVPATYDIVAIGPRQQVIANLVVGDPARPDLTAEKVVIDLGVGWTGPTVQRISVTGARLYARYSRGAFSLGALDPLLFSGSTASPALPALDVAIRDGRALVESDYGRIGLKLEGAGRLDDGFAGTLAATAPGIGTPGCRAETATLYGKLTTVDGAPRLDGPLRVAGLACAGARLARADIGTRLSLRREFTSLDADLRPRGRGLGYASLTGEAITGTARLSWNPQRLALAHDLVLRQVTVPQGRLASLAARGGWRGTIDGSRGEWEGDLRGEGLDPAKDIAARLADTERSVAGTLLAPLVAKARGGLGRALPGASFRADAIIRHNRGEVALVIPEASLTSPGGTRVLALSRLGLGIGSAGRVTRLAGSILAGGEGLPVINGRIAQTPGGGWDLRVAMADYAAGPNRLAIPRLSLRQSADGLLRFEGSATASGVLPGGRVDDLAVPFEGIWSSARGLALGTRCTALRFRQLALSGLALAGQAITLCPEGRGPLLAYAKSLRLAARTGPVSLAGRVGESPARFAASQVALRYPQPFAVDGLTATIGSGETEVRLAAASLTGSLAGDITGSFAGGSARLAAVPLDLDAIGGRWSFADSTLTVSDTAFTLSDRPAEGSAARFAPLAAAGAHLTYAGNRITAEATLRHPGSGRHVTDVAIRHDLGTAAGSARLAVPGLLFDKQLQPEDVSLLAKGVIANARGTISGTGQIDWTADDITSSGTFGSDGFDFAAAFGPVRGMKGEVVFTDLLNLTTAPDQRLAIAAINPGVEVLDGTVIFALTDGTRLAIADARFPFMGGTLTMRPVALDFGAAEQRRFVFEITGLDAAKFVSQLELTNLAATGTFDGTVPITFDADGNGRIEGGLLIARPGGGNIAYIGELTYEDLGTMGNYAFSALRSLDYRQMSVGLGGDLAGEIVTNFAFDGVRQGAGTSQNFVTRRLARLPIRFRVNVRSENFYQLATMVRSIWDADYLANPVDQGLLKAEGGRFVRVPPPVQPAESEDKP